MTNEIVITCDTYMPTVRIDGKLQRCDLELTYSQAPDAEPLTVVGVTLKVLGKL